jgi:hypothetical protein
MIKLLDKGVNGMSVLNKIETKVAGLLKSVPHLPKGGQKWVADNAWWIVLIGVVASAISILVAIGAIFTYLAFVGNASSYYGYYVASPYGGGWVLATIVSLAFSVALLIVSAMAVGQLKSHNRKGWSLLFVAWLLSALNVVLGAILSFSVQLVWRFLHTFCLKLSLILLEPDPKPFPQSL